MNDVIAIMLSMVVAMLSGALFMLLVGGSFTIKYLRVKTSRGKRVLLFLKTPFGWVAKIASKKENTLYWEHDKIKYITHVEDEHSITRYSRVDAAYCDLNKPTVALKLGKGQFYPPDFDQQTFNNLLIRAATKPQATGTDDLKKLVQVLLIIVIILGIGMMLIYGKLGAVQQSIKLLNTIPPAVL